MSNQLPTKPGHYHWREKDGDEWEVGKIYRGFDGELHFETVNIAGDSVEELGGQWSPIPTPDEGIEAWAVFDDSGDLFHVGNDRDFAEQYANDMIEATGQKHTVQPVIIYKSEVGE